MFTRSAFISGRTPSVPGFPRNDTARGKEKEEDEKERNQPSLDSTIPLRPGPSVSQPVNLPLDSRSEGSIAEKSSTPIGQRVSLGPLDILAEAAAARHTPVQSRDQLILAKRAKIKALKCQLAEKKKQMIEVETQMVEMEKESQARKGSKDFAGSYDYPDTVSCLAVDEDIDRYRETLCIKWGKKVWEDISEFTIYPMLNIQNSDRAMIVRVKDLVFSIPSCD